MILVPNFPTLAAWAASAGIRDTDPAALVARPEVHDKLEREARKLLRDLAQFETPKKFLVLPAEFSIATGELTPKLSVRRKVIASKWESEIEALYQDS